ncbi:MAG: type VI secretion system ATPase TssH [Pirellulales bacterium]|nr:type VI secretion system ATPase TssH [Pirellulales bacterium]
MATTNLKALVARLNPICRQALEGAAGLCLSRSHYNVEIEHWLLKILEYTNSDIDAIAQHFDVNLLSLASSLTRTLDRLKTGNARPPALSQNIVDLTSDAWLICSIDYDAPKIRSGHLFLALLGDDMLRRTIISASDEFEKISIEALRASLLSLTSETAEAADSRSISGTGGDRGAPAARGPTQTPALDQFTIDLTARARDGQIDPVLGRDDEIRQIIDVLSRRRQNNPILTGEAGVGKTAVVEGFALRIAAGDVPPALDNVSLRILDLALLQAGAGVKGEFENRLKSVIEEVKASPSPIILFIDEAHNMVGAGGQAGQGDAANLLKPALARGELRTIAATTWAEYKKYFEKDAALARRFQVIQIDEPTESEAIEMMRGVVATLENHHKVRITNEAVEEAVKLSSRYISGRQLPDKSVSLLDTTCARIRLSQTSVPPAIEDCRRRIEQFNVTLGILRREAAAGADHHERIEETTRACQAAEQELANLESRWEMEKELVTQIDALRKRLENPPVDQTESAEDSSKKAGPSDDQTLPATAFGEEQTKVEEISDTMPSWSPKQEEEIRTQLRRFEQEMIDLQGELPLVHICCDGSAIASTVAAWTGIPVGRMVADEIKTILTLKELMEESIVGQSHALEQISESIRTSRAGLTDPTRPIGVFLLAGTSGVGKTETAITLAQLLYGGEQNMTVINMSEFKEEHKVSLLMGAPPGYVGHGEGGVLTEAVRRKPYSVLLLDEMEKAHPGVQDIFYQVFDKGRMQDSDGREIDFKNTVIFMTSNAGSDLIKKLCGDPETLPDPETFTKAIYPELLKTFKPAFLGRLSIVPFYPLSESVLGQIVRLKLAKVAKRIRDHYNAEFAYSDALVDVVVSRCTEVDTGARNVDKIFNTTLLPEMSTEFLARMGVGERITGVKISVGPEGNFVYEMK